MIDVDVVVRSDARSKAGGDSEQVRQYEHFLKSDVLMRIVPFSPRLVLRPTAVVHIVNIDRPFDFLQACRAARGHRVIVSPIHHSLARTRRMRAAESGRGVRSTLDRVLPESPREWLASAIRNGRAESSIASVVGDAWRSMAWVRRVWERVGVELEQSAAVALLAPGEGRDLADDTGWSGANGVLIPNGAPPAGDLPAWSDRHISILNVGRIEPRKRSLELALEADQRQTRITFVGHIVDESSRYARDFLRLTEASAFANYAGAKSHDEVMTYMRNSRVLVNASWVEVQSLVDMEAAFSGTRVVSVPNGNSRDWIPSHVTYVDDFDLGTLLGEAARQAAAPCEVSVPDYGWDWARSANALLDVYRP